MIDVQRMAKFACTFVLAAGTSSYASGDQKSRDAPPALSPGKHWKIAWQDEFNGARIDQTKWNVLDQDPRGEGAWSGKNVILDGAGHLVFLVTERNGRLTAGGMDTIGKFQMRGGYFVIRCKLPRYARYRPAFWITSPAVTHLTGNDGRRGTEIDIMEQQPMSEDSRKVIETLHWNGYGKFERSVGTEAPVTLDLGQWHTFGVWWSVDKYQFYIDGQRMWQSDAGGVSQAEENIKLGVEMPWKQEQFERLPFGPDDRFVVDYVRVYKHD